MSRRANLSHRTDGEIATLRREVARELDREIGNLETAEADIVALAARVTAIEDYLNALQAWLTSAEAVHAFGNLPPDPDF